MAKWTKVIRLQKNVKQLRDLKREGYDLNDEFSFSITSVRGLTENEMLKINSTIE